MSYWQKRGLYLLFLPAYSPHLNIAGTLWRKIKKNGLFHLVILSKMILPTQ